MRFIIDQVALCPADPARAIELLTAMGLKDWARDHVAALGFVANAPVEKQAGMYRDATQPAKNEADLAFNYEGFADRRELEVLHYTGGVNWMSGQQQRVSHLVMHCSYAELEKWREFFVDRGITVAQEVNTWSHSNPEIAGKRWYHYCIFDTFAILGVDIKFIVRREEPR